MTMTQTFPVDACRDVGLRPPPTLSLPLGRWGFSFSAWRRRRWHRAVLQQVQSRMLYPYPLAFIDGYIYQPMEEFRKRRYAHRDLPVMEVAAEAVAAFVRREPLEALVEKHDRELRRVTTELARILASPPPEVISFDGYERERAVRQVFHNVHGDASDLTGYLNALAALAHDFARESGLGALQVEQLRKRYATP
jgi:hypothetical protein